MHHWRHIYRANNAPFSIFNKEDPQFRDLQHTVDSISSNLHKKGIGAAHKSTLVVTIEDKIAFWATGLLGMSTPQILQHIMFFNVGLQFCLRGVQEHYNLTLQQFTRFSVDTSIYDDTVYY